jgi:RNA polymerase sigma factor (sigma-70 family)
MSPGGFPRLPGVQSDQRLLALAREGDQHAFEALVRRYRRPLLRYCRRMGLSDSRAEDVLQQALLRAWLALERGAEVRAPKAWLYRTVHNTAVNALRGERDHGPLQDGATVEFAASAESDFERRVALRQALTDVAGLPQMQRDAILLTAIDGRSHEEIASALGVTHGAVRGLLYRARATLRDAAAALLPPPALLWVSGLLGRASPTAAKLAEVSAPAGNADIGGMLAKGAALAATAAVLAVGTGVVPLPRHLAHRSKAAVLGLGIAPTTAEAQASESPSTAHPGGPLAQGISSGSADSRRGHGSDSSHGTSTAPSGRRPRTGADGGERSQPGDLSGSGRGSGDAEALRDGKDDLSGAPGSPSRSGSGSYGLTEASPADPPHGGQGSECDHCSDAAAGSGADEARASDAEPTPLVSSGAPAASAETLAERRGRD